MVKKACYRLAVLNSHPIQYFAPLYRRLAKEPTIDLTVHFCSTQGANDYFDAGFGKQIKWDVPVLEGYNHKFLPNLSHSKEVGGFTSLINPGIIKELRRNRYDALWLHGYSYLSDWLALASATLLGIPILYRSEASLTYDSLVQRPLHVRLIKPVLLRWMFRRVQRFLSIGRLNREFYLHYGARPEEIYHVPYTVDNDFFTSTTLELRQRRNEIRKELEIGPNDVVFLFAAKMTSKKAPLQVLEAYRRLGDIPGKSLIMAGDGHLRAEAERYAKHHNLHSVRFVGFVNQSELPRYYCISDVFLRPDGLYKGDWGLTINEAMAARLAVITTDAIGAAVDLVHDMENGFVVRFGDTEQLARCMRLLTEDPTLCARMGAKSAEVIKTWSYEQCVSGVLRALESLTNTGSTTPA